MEALALVLYVLAVARVTRLVNHDAVLDPLRVRVYQRFGEHGEAAYFLGCAWCVSVWAAAALLPLLVAVTAWPWAFYALAAPAASWCAGMLAQLDKADHVVVEEA